MTQSTNTSAVEITILMPCLNEAETLATCIEKAHEGLQLADARGEILIADNGSTDGSQEIARTHGARVVDVPIRGYGAALRYGIKASVGKYVLMGDSDDSYDFREVEKFLEKLREGYQLVMGTRLKGTIEPGAMPPLHQYLGNPVLTFTGNLLFRSGLSDFHCGMRGFDRQAILDLNLQTNGMEFATEMVAKAAMADLRRTEVPITLHKDGRSRPPHLNTWRDGWRHLSFMLIMSPGWVFLLPALLFLGFGIIGTVLTLPGVFRLGNVGFGIHTLLIANFAIVIGVQLLIFWAATQLFMSRLDPNRQSVVSRWAHQGFPLSIGLLTGFILLIIGVIPVLATIVMWGRQDFQGVDPTDMMRWLIPGLTLSTVGIQIFFGSFVLSLLNFTEDEKTVEIGD